MVIPEQKMVDERRRLKPMKVEKYEEFRLFKPFSSSFLYLYLHPLVSSLGYFVRLKKWVLCKEIESSNKVQNLN